MRLFPAVVSEFHSIVFIYIFCYLSSWARFEITPTANNKHNEQSICTAFIRKLMAWLKSSIRKMCTAAAAAVVYYPSSFYNLPLCEMLLLSSSLFQTALKKYRKKFHLQRINPSWLCFTISLLQPFIFGFQ